MRLTKHRRKTTAAMDMTPMIDITFQLMIFFMACSQISKTNNKNVDLPKQPGSVDQQETTTLTVNIDAAGDIEVSGRALSLNDLIFAVSQDLVAAENEPSRIKVVLRVDRTGTSRTVNDVFTALKKQGITQVRITTERSE